MDDSNISAGMPAGAPAPAEPATPPAQAQAEPSAAADTDGGAENDPAGTSSAAKRRRRGSRGGQNRKRPDGTADDGVDEDAASVDPDELPEPMREGRVSDPEAADKALVRKPKVGDIRAPFVPAMPPPGPAKPAAASAGANANGATAKTSSGSRKRRRGGSGRSRTDSPGAADSAAVSPVNLDEAFSALLAAEQGLAVAPGPAAGVMRAPSATFPETLPDATLDAIAARVIARMGDDKMRAAVLDAAERLVREEIDRIKNAR